MCACVRACECVCVLILQNIVYTDNNIKKLKILEVLHIKFRQLSIDRINFETSDNNLKFL